MPSFNQIDDVDSLYLLIILIRIATYLRIIQHSMVQDSLCTSCYLTKLLTWLQKHVPLCHKHDTYYALQQHFAPLQAGTTAAAVSSLINLGHLAKTAAVRAFRVVSTVFLVWYIAIIISLDFTGWIRLSERLKREVCKISHFWPE